MGKRGRGLEITVDKHKRATWRSVAFLIALFLVWSTLASYLNYRVEKDSNTPFTENISSEGESQYVTVETDDVKFWVNDKGQVTQTVGAQYDGVIENIYTSDIRDWKLVVTLPDEGTLDSSWNGTYEMDGNKLTIIPDKNTNVIPAGQNKTFGFIMISKLVLEFEEYEFTGYRQTTYTEYPLFWALIIMLIVWLAMAFSLIIVEARVKHFKEQRENDAKIISQTMKTFAQMIDAKDPYTKGHSVRVAYYSQEIGKRLHMDDEECTKLGYIALMHDCGKLGVPDYVLTKPGRLDAEERKLIETHTIIGGKVLENYTSIDGIKDGALYHHERYDGKGYPKGIAGKEIPLYARIIGIADAFDAMNSDRCYRKHLPKEVILTELHDHAGTQFDPEIVKHMIAMVEEGICEKNIAVE